MQTCVDVAFEQGRAALAGGDVLRAGDLLEYAHRYEPGNDVVALTLACVRMQRSADGAVELLRQVTSRHDVREVWHSLAVFQSKIGLTDAAAGDLARLLGCHAPLDDTDAQATYDTIALEAGAPGWSGVTSDGVLTISLPSSPDMTAGLVAELAIDLDGRPLEARATRAGGRATCWLPAGWQQGRRLQVRLGERPLIGSPHHLAAIARTEGLVWSRDGGLEGWAWMPGNPDRDPVITVRAVNPPHKTIRIVATEPWSDLENHAPLARPRRLDVSAAALAALKGAVEVIGTDGRQLYGAPLDPGAEQRSAAAGGTPVYQRRPTEYAQPARTPLVALPAGLPARQLRGIDIVIPVHGGLELTLACLRHVQASVGDAARIVVIDDASPDPELAAALDAQARDGRIVLERLPRNRGFPAAANAGMRLAADHDVVLLNNDTIVPQGWLERLRAAAYSAPDIGTVTPLSNNATILSYPSCLQVNDVPSAEDVVSLDAAAQAANAGVTVEIPTAVGFCMYIRRDCLEAVGGFREDVFAQGYGEENDFCLRAQHLGWRHVALAGLYVGHVGGQTFGAARYHLMERNLRIINRLHPGYHALVTAFQEADSLAPARRRMDEVRWRAGRGARGAVILVGHAAGGGVRRRLLERCEQIRNDGRRPILLLPGPTAGGVRRTAVSEAKPDAYPNLVFAMPGELEALVTLLRAERPAHVELHHWIGHDTSVFDLARRLGIPCDVVVHDYAWFCPRVTLTGADGRYCGEPPAARCETCVREAGGRLKEEITPVALRQRSRAVLRRARKVTAPSRDTARRTARQFEGLGCAVEEPEADAPASPLPRRPRPPGGLVRVCVVGGISLQKGYDYLLDCARDVVARSLPIRFALVGHSHDDARLLETGVVSITGPYEEAETQALIRQQAAHVGFLPAQWPETWSYTLSHMWQAGLDVFVFDIGAPAERASRRGRGRVLPLGLPSRNFNDIVLRTC